MKKNTDKLAKAVAEIDADTLRGSLAKGTFVQFRATEEEKKSLKQTADSLDLSVSEYLLKVHSLIAEKLGGKTK
jgi:hypothetical protein